MAFYYLQDVKNEVYWWLEKLFKPPKTLCSFSYSDGMKSHLKLVLNYHPPLVIDLYTIITLLFRIRYLLYWQYSVLKPFWITVSHFPNVNSAVLWVAWHVTVLHVRSVDRAPRINHLVNGVGLLNHIYRIIYVLKPSRWY